MISVTSPLASLRRATSSTRIKGGAEKALDPLELVSAGSPPLLLLDRRKSVKLPAVQPTATKTLLLSM